VLFVGLTGGIGSGKSTVARMLADRGAIVIDADDLARRAVGAGTEGHGRVAEAFGPSVLRSDGSIDRERLADLVFRDRHARRTLESIIHPQVAKFLADSIEPYRGTRRVVVYDVPLLVENRLESMFDVVVVVEAPEHVRTSRLRTRGMSEDAVGARMAAQLSDEERVRVADVVIRNDGTMDELGRKVDALWADLETRESPS
jgi:dephospho-CoA kinase